MAARNAADPAVAPLRITVRERSRRAPRTSSAARPDKKSMRKATERAIGRASERRAFDSDSFMLCGGGGSARRPAVRCCIETTVRLRLSRPAAALPSTVVRVRPHIAPLGPTIKCFTTSMATLFSIGPTSRRLYIPCWSEFSRRRLLPSVSPAAGHLTTPTVAGLSGLCENFRPQRLPRVAQFYAC